MSIEVRIPKEITEYKEKILFGLSLRQLICFAIAIIAGVATYYFGSMFLGRDMASYLVIVEVIPVFAIGFVRKNGFTFEKYAALMFRHKFGTHKRHYKTKLEIESIVTENGKEKQVKGDKKNAAIQKVNSKGDKNKRECKVFEVGEKSRKRKSKEAYREIKAARKEFKRAKQEAFKAAEKRISS